MNAAKRHAARSRAARKAAATRKANRAAKLNVKKPNRRTSPTGPSNNQGSTFGQGLVIGALVIALLVLAFLMGTWMVKATQPVAAAAPQSTAAAPANPGAPTDPAGPAAPAQGSDYQGTDACVDGKIVSNQFADISRIPIGTREGAVVAEISWTGSGFGGFDRAIVVVPRMTAETMAFVRNSKTIHLVQYCGFLKDILNYAPTHVDALVQSSQDDAGNRPDPQEIGVYYVDLSGAWTVVREGPKGPGLDFVKLHVVMTPQ